MKKYQLRATGDKKCCAKNTIVHTVQGCKISNKKLVPDSLITWYDVSWCGGRLIERIFNIRINEEQNNWNKGINVLFFFKLNGSLTGNKLPPMIRVAFLLAWQCPPHRASTLWWAIILSVKTLIGGRPSLENPNNMKIKAPLLNSGRWVFYGEGFFALLYIILPMLLVLRWLLSGTIWVNSHLSQTGMTK